MKTIVKYNLLFLCILALMGLTACSSNEDGTYTSKIYDLSTEEESLVTEPSPEYIIAALSQIDSIFDIEIASEPVDKPKDNAISTIYFSSENVDQSDFEEDERAEKRGTASGGSIDIFKTTEAAIERDEYLHGFDGKPVFESGGHAVAGTLVIRTSKNLNEKEQINFTDEIVKALTSGNITDDMIEAAMKTYNEKNALSSDGKIKIPFSSDDIVYKPYTEIEKELKNLGFTNIQLETQNLNPDIKEEFDGSILAIHIDENHEFEKNDKFDPEVPIVITYSKDNRIRVPKSSIKCEELPYKEVVSLFSEAGFTNVSAVAHEVDYTENVAEGSIVIISVDDNPIFEENALFNSDVPVMIHYRVFKDQEPETTPQITEEPTPTEAPSTSENNEAMVWIPQSGSKYHSKPSCGRMKNATQVPLSKAESMGYEPCKRCH